MSLAKVGKKVSFLEAIETDLLEQPAVQVWMKIQPECPVPKRIEYLRHIASSAFVCRMPGVGKNGSAVIAKRCDRQSGLMERMFYEEVLPQVRTSKLEYYGSFEDGDEYLWLFLEDAGGRRFTFSNAEDRLAAVHWLADLHTSSSNLDKPDGLVERDPDYYFERLLTARSVQREHVDDSALTETDKQTLVDGLAQMGRAIENWSAIQDLYQRVPHCVTHGDFKKKNIHLRNDAEGISIFAFDWENGGWGVPGVDMWKLDEEEYLRAVNGHWPDSDITSIREIKYLGTIFRAIDGFFWEVKSLKYADNEHVRLRVIERLFRFRMHMENAMQALGIRG